MRVDRGSGVRELPLLKRRACRFSPGRTIILRPIRLLNKNGLVSSVMLAHATSPSCTGGPILRAGNDAFGCLRYAGYTGQSMASAKRAKIMETPPMENRSRSDISCPLAAVTLVGAREGASSCSRRGRELGRPTSCWV